MVRASICAIIGFAATTSIATPATAAPTYLKCIFPANDGEWPVDITADEGESSVTLIMPRSGRMERLRGAFGPDNVIFGNAQIRYILSRTDLTIQRFTPIIREAVTGKCKIAPPPKREF